MKIQHLFERIGNRSYVKNPSSTRLQSYIDGRVERYARAVVDTNGDFYIFNPYEYIHIEFRSKMGINVGSDPLSGLSLYVFSDSVACRLNDVEDEAVHPEMTDRIRQNKNIVRAYGTEVTCIDIHHDP